MLWFFHFLSILIIIMNKLSPLKAKWKLHHRLKEPAHLNPLLLWRNPCAKQC